MPLAERAEQVQRFQTDPSKQFFVLSTRAGGVGINLTGACRVIMYDLWWNPAVEDQAIDRAHRIGQTKDVEVFRLVCPGTFEEKVDRILQEKREISAECLTDLHSHISVGDLSDDALCRMFHWDSNTGHQAPAAPLRGR